jgi:hypothetical protein
MKLSSLVLVTVIALAAGACSSDGKGGGDAAAGSSGGGNGGTSGSAGSGGSSGVAGTTGSGGATGSGGRGGATGGGGTTGGAGTAGTQPVGAACANTANCSQADGPAVCCLQISTCVLQNQCPGTPTYVSCETMPCEKAGWVCCNAGGMRFCTKQSGCPSP